MYFLKTSQVGIWPVKMVLIPCMNIVYSRICFKNFLIIDNKSSNESIYRHATDGISNCLNRLLQGALGCVTAITLTIFFCTVKIFPLLEHFPPVALRLNAGYVLLIHEVSRSHTTHHSQ